MLSIREESAKKLKTLANRMDVWHPFVYHLTVWVVIWRRKEERKCEEKERAGRNGERESDKTISKRKYKCIICTRTQYRHQLITEEGKQNY